MIASLISDAKNALVTPDRVRVAGARSRVAQRVASVYRELEPALRARQRGDLRRSARVPVELFRNDESLRKLGISDRFQFILVDEYQDTNRAQYQFIKLLGGAHRNVVVVGDDDQSIYGWRGADIRNILDFEKEFPAARVVRLEENYRSTPDILDVANARSARTSGERGRRFARRVPAGERVTLVAALDERDEADWVVEEIMSRRRRENARLRDFAILYRTNAQSRAIEDALRKHAMPYRLVGAVRFYDRREIRDLMAYLKLIANPVGQRGVSARGRGAQARHRRYDGRTRSPGRAQGAGIPMLEAARGQS